MTAISPLRRVCCTASRVLSFGRTAVQDCERLLDNIRALIAEPNMRMLGGNDEDDAEKQMSAGKLKVQRGAAVGRRGEKSAKPLMSIESLAPA
jgi:hypothetical protein